MEGLSFRILEYLVDHPRAADTAAGISEWWLGNRVESMNPAEVEAVLERLVQQGHLQKILKADGQYIYYRPPIRNRH